MRNVLASLLITGMSLAWLFHFGCLWIYGNILVQEPNKLILALETILLLTTLSFGIYLLSKQFRATH